MDMEKATALLLSIIMLLMTPAAASDKSAGDSWIHRILQLVSQQESEEISFAVTRTSVPLRSAPNILADTEVQLDEGVCVEVLKIKITGGTKWAHVRYGSAEGWVRLYLLTAVESRITPENTASTKEAFNLYASPSQNGAVVTKLNQGESLQMIQTEYYASIRWAFVDAPSRGVSGWIPCEVLELPQTWQESYPSTNYIRMGVINTSRLNIRLAPGTNNLRIGSYGYGQRIGILEIQGEWGRTNRGWIYLPYTYLDGNLGQHPMVGNVATAQLNVRTGPGTGYRAVGSIREGDRVLVLEQFSIGSLVWGYTRAGWICMNYVKPDYIPGTTTPIYGYGYVAQDEALYSGAGTGNPVVGTVPARSLIPVWNVISAEGISWGQTPSGWVNMAHVNMSEVYKHLNPPPKPADPSIPCTALAVEAMGELTAAGQTWQLKVTVSPANTTDAITYTSKNPAVVTVDKNGLVTAVGEGSTTIVITCGQRQAEVTATVKFPAPTVPCTGLVANPIDEFTAAGQTQQLSVTVSPADTTDTVTYSSNDTAVVTVDEKGLVTAIGEGSTAIVITCGDQQIEVAATVKFPAPTVPCTGLVANPIDEFTAAGQTQQLNVTVSPADTTDTVTYSSNDTAVVTVDEKGLVTAVGEGSTAIVITCGDQRIEVAATVKFPPPTVPCTGLVANPIDEFTAAGQTQRLSVTVSPADTTDTLAFISSNPAVVTVDGNGLVTAVGEGSTAIVITCGDQRIEVTAVVNFPDPPAESETPSESGETIEPRDVPEPVQTIDLSTEPTIVDTVELTAPGQTKQLKVTLAPTDSPDLLTFTSNDPTVVSVDSRGLITVVGEGSTVIVIAIGDRQIKVPVVVTFQ